MTNDNNPNTELQTLSEEYYQETIDYQYDELQLELEEMLNQFVEYDQLNQNWE